MKEKVTVPTGGKDGAKPQRAPERDWERIRTEYITTDTSYRILSEKYGIGKGVVDTRARKENWVQQRRQFREKTGKKDTNQLSVLMDTVQHAIAVVADAFEDTEQFRRHLIRIREKVDEEERQWTEERVFDKLDTKALKDLTAVLKDLTGMMRQFHNIPTPSEQIAQQRLELARQKLEGKNGPEDEEGGVLILPPVQETGHGT